MKKIFILLFFIIAGLPLVGIGQINILNGIVIDQMKTTPVAFVKIGINNNKYFVASDINGLFTIRLNEPILQLQIKHPGYQPQTIDASGKSSPLVIKLVPGTSAIDSLAALSAGVYREIDSVMLMEKMAAIRQREKAMLSGEIPVGFFSLDVSKLKRFNNFEGFYLGAGGHTNEKLSRSFSLGGFMGYGFKDKKTKQGFDLTVWPGKLKHLTFKAGYSYDTQEGGGSLLFDEKSEILDPASFRSLYVDKMNYEERIRFSLSCKINNSLLYGAVQQRIINPGYDILYGVKVMYTPHYYNVSGIVAGIRWSPGKPLNSDKEEDVFQKTNNPVVWLQVTKGIQDFRKGNWSYNRFEGKIHYTTKVPRLGRSSVLLVGNYLNGNAPYFEYFNGRGSYGNFGLFASGSFVTMHPNEFLNDKTLGLFLTHTFENIFPKTEMFNPCPVLVFNYGWGKMNRFPADYYLPVTDMHKGYVEAGIQINNLLDLKVYGLGLGAYYRMGAYSNTSGKDNLVFKIVVSFPGKD